MGWVFLGIAIIFEVAAALSLKFSVPTQTGDSYKLLPAILMVIFYLLCFAAMIQAVRTLPLGLMYAIWGGVGTAAIATFSWQIWGEHMSFMKVSGIALIIMGVVLANLSKDSSKHDPLEDQIDQPELEASAPPVAAKAADPPRPSQATQAAL